MKDDEAVSNLAKKAAAGDEDSFAALCEAMQARLFRAAKGILGDDGLALEAVSEAVFRAYGGIRRLRKPQFASTWFTRILINAANDIYKRQKRETAFSRAPEGVYYDEYSGLELEEAISSLPPELRVIISLKYYSEYTLEEISRILSIPVGTVKSRLNRALSFGFIFGLCAMLTHLDNAATIGPNLAVSLITMLYSIAIGYFVFFPVQAWAELKIARQHQPSDTSPDA